MPRAIPVGFRVRSQGERGHDELLAQAKHRVNAQGWAVPGRPVVHKPREGESGALSPIPSSRAEYPESAAAHPPDSSAFNAPHQIIASASPVLPESSATPAPHPRSDAASRVLPESSRASPAPMQMKPKIFKDGQEHGQVVKTRSEIRKLIKKAKKRKSAPPGIQVESDGESDEDSENNRTSSPKRSIFPNQKTRLRPPQPGKKEAWQGPWLALPKLCQVEVRRKKCEREVVGAPDVIGGPRLIKKERLRFMSMERGMEWNHLAAAAQKADKHAALVGKLPCIFGSYNGLRSYDELD